MVTIKLGEKVLDNKILLLCLCFLLLLAALYGVYIYTDYLNEYLRIQKELVETRFGLVFVFAVILSPLLEEIVFRKYLFSLFVIKINANVSVFIISFIWVMLHIELPVLASLFLFCFGLILGFLRLWTGKLYLSVLFHFVNNLMFFIFLVCHA